MNNDPELQKANYGSPNASIGAATVRLWDPASGQEVFTLRERDQDATAVAFSRDGHALLFGSGTSLAVWDGRPPEPGAGPRP
jgi:hypothetical protein